MSEAQLPPSPNDSKIRQALGLGIGIWEYMEKCQKEIGETFTLTLPGQGPMVWTTEPEVIKDVLKLKANQYDQSLVQLPMDLGQHNTVFLNDKEHLDSRKMVIPPLNLGPLKARASVMHDIVTEHIDNMKPGDNFDMPRLIGDITLDVICYTLFDLRHGERKDKYKELMLNWMLEATSDTMFTLASMVGAGRFRGWLNKMYLRRTAEKKFGNGKKGILPWKRAVDLKVQLADMVRKDIHEARERNDESETHMLSILARATDEDGNYLSEERVISEAIGLMIGGHETSAATGAWLGIWLQQKPEINARIAQEVIDAVNEEGEYIATKTCELPFLTACLNESQRLTPSAVGFIRWLREDTKLGDLYLPAGSSILPAIYLIHRSKEVFGDDVNEYRPDRWLEGKKFAPYEFLPFGGGRRACIGMNQARQQLRLIFGELARRVEFTSEFDGGNTLPRSRMIGGQTEPEKGVKLTVKTVRPFDHGFSDEVKASLGQRKSA